MTEHHRPVLVIFAERCKFVTLEHPALVSEKASALRVVVLLWTFFLLGIVVLRRKLTLSPTLLCSHAFP